MYVGLRGQGLSKTKLSRTSRKLRCKNNRFTYRYSPEMIIGGRLAPGEVHELKFPANLIMASSFFLFTALILISLTDLKHKNRIIELTFLTAITLFITSVFI